MDTQPFYLWLPVQAPKVINMDLMRCYIVQVVAIFMNIHALLKMPSHKKTTYIHRLLSVLNGYWRFWSLQWFCICIYVYVFFLGVGGGGDGDGAVLVSREDKIEILLNGKLFSKSSWIFWFMARLFPLQRSLIHFLVRCQKVSRSEENLLRFGSSGNSGISVSKV